jgi:hypothetical protein
MKMVNVLRYFITRKLLVIVILLMVLSSNAQKVFFSDINEKSIANAVQKRVIVPLKYRTVTLDTLSLVDFLKYVPSEKNITGHNHNTAPVIKIPMPDGTVSSFHIWESSIMEPGLAAKFPNLKTYTGQGIEDRTAVIKIDWTGFGFHAMVLSPVTTSVFIDPYAQGSKTNYISYFKSDMKNTEPFTEENSVTNSLSQDRPASTGYEPTQLCIGEQLRTYRLAVACTHQYAMAATGLSNPTDTQALAAIVTSINRVDGVYEQELDIHFNLVANEDTIVFVNTATDPFTANSNPSSLIIQSQRVIDSYIGDTNYDIGHTFSTGGGGLTLMPGIVCVSNKKASSETGLANPVGDPFNIDYVSHEIGHEFGAYHSFNSNQGFCAQQGQWFSNANSEPGSGTTIMCYAGGGAVADPNSLCGTDNLQVHSDPDFNALGFDEITQYIINGNGNGCGVASVTGNTPPVVNAGSDYIIPKSTPFILTGSATDIDGDSLTYSWEEVDIGGPECQWNQPSLNAPIFRSFPPVTSPSRYFPKLSDVINNTTTIGEIMPSYTRALNFRLTVRDNHAGGGGVCNDENVVTVDSSGPFIVTYPDTANIIWNANDSETVTWNPAGTQVAPVNCSNVMIQLSTDGGLTYPGTLLASTSNTGSARILVPDNLTSTGRVRVMAVGNVFYNISNNNFSIQSPVCPSSNLFITSGVTGSAYQWQVNTGNGYTSITDDTIYTDTHANVLQLKNPPTSWYGYKYHCVVTVADGTENSAEFILKFAEQWIGNTSTAWENPQNWSCGLLPDTNTDVIINSGTPYFPIVNSNSSIRSLTVSPTASVTVNPNYNLTITH